jgi:hypothetical protein
MSYPEPAVLKRARDRLKKRELDLPTATQRVEAALDKMALVDRVVGILIERPEYRFVSLDLVSDVARKAIMEYRQLLSDETNG